MSRDITVIPFRQPEAIDDPLTEVAREGAGLAVEARCPRPAAQRAHRGRRADRVRARLQDGAGRHRLEAQDLEIAVAAHRTGSRARTRRARR
jgi:hypothetical protein